MRIIVDAMGGDNAPQAPVQGALQAIKEYGVEVVLVGKENPNSAFADSSVIISKYRIGQDNTGAMGLIGPIRMDYARVIPHLEYFSQTLGRLLEATLEEQK